MNPAVYSFFGQTSGVGSPIDVRLNRLTDKTLLGHSQTIEAGTAHYYGINLSKPGYQNVMGAGTTVGRNPVSLELGDIRVPTAQVAKLLHIWVTCERFMSIVGGKVFVSGS